MIYINDLLDGLESLAKLFADDISLFFKVYNSNVSARQLSNDLQKITVWAHKWEVSLTFNVISVAQSSYQKHLGLNLDEKLNFSHHIKEITSKLNKGIDIIRKLRSILPRNALITNYKAFLRPNIDYCDFIYDQPHNESFCNNL